MRQSLKAIVVLWMTLAGLFFHYGVLSAAGPHANGLTQIGAAVNEFGFDLYRHLQKTEGNLFFSPYSITTSLSMTCAGAQGDTKAQMGHVLHAGAVAGSIHSGLAGLDQALRDARDKKQIELHLANALWMEKEYRFLEGFLDFVKGHYDAVLERVDFKHAARQAVEVINRWVEKRTDGKIRDLIDPGSVDSSTRLVLTNAVCFKGAWKSTFNPGDTKDSPFFLPDSKTIFVPMMHRKADFAYLEGPDYQAIEMPYAGDDFSMLILLPKETGGLKTLDSRLNPAFLDSCDARLKKREVRVFIPKFSFSTPFTLSHILKEMGMQDAFTLRADFSGIDGTRRLLIGNVFHSAFVDVNEQGTEASAGTAVVMKLGAAPGEPAPVFKADHPFVFFIRHKASGAILFMGRVVNPG